MIGITLPEIWHPIEPRRENEPRTGHPRPRQYVHRGNGHASLRDMAVGPPLRCRRPDPPSIPAPPRCSRASSSAWQHRSAKMASTVDHPRQDDDVSGRVLRTGQHRGPPVARGQHRLAAQHRNRLDRDARWEHRCRLSRRRRVALAALVAPPGGSPAPRRLRPQGPRLRRARDWRAATRLRRHPVRAHRPAPVASRRRALGARGRWPRRSRQRSARPRHVALRRAEQS